MDSTILQRIDDGVAAGTKCLQGHHFDPAKDAAVLVRGVSRDREEGAPDGVALAMDGVDACEKAMGERGLAGAGQPGKKDEAGNSREIAVAHGPVIA